jgi:hypothetical protein
MKGIYSIRGFQVCNPMIILFNCPNKYGKKFIWAQLMRQEGTNGTWKRDFKEQLPLGNERTINGIYWKTVGLEIVKRALRTSSWLQRIKEEEELDLMELSTPSKT